MVSILSRNTKAPAVGEGFEGVTGRCPAVLFGDRQQSKSPRITGLESPVTRRRIVHTHIQDKMVAATLSGRGHEFSDN